MDDRIANIDLPEHEFDFSYARSSGPGGQNVNKVNSKAVLHWPVRTSKAFNPTLLQRFCEKFANHINNEGEFVISSDRFRDQARNVEDCREKLRRMLAVVLFPPRPRIATKPSRNQRAQRMGDKRERGEKKKMRQKIKY